MFLKKISLKQNIREEKLKEEILNDVKDDFPEEIIVNVKTIVSYR